MSVYDVWHKGEIQFKARVRKNSGFSVVASEADFDNIKKQIKDAIAFLQRNAEELKRLKNYPEVEEPVLDFGIEDRDVAVQCDYFPAQLLFLAGNLGIGLEISRYPQSEE